jgi:phosphatidylglycerol:prolipoprotein diacylglycerol transferase
MNVLAEIAYPRIDPVVFHVGPLPVRWYGVSYILAFVSAYLVLRGLAKRKRWPVAPDRVADVLFWGILGVFLGGRIGWEFFYAITEGHFDLGNFYKVWQGGMSFHGGLLGVILAYWIWTAKAKVPRGDFFDGLSLATPPGIFLVRMANFINAELYGRPWNGPWAMRFPAYPGENIESWDGHTFTEPRHPSQLYEGLAEGLLLFVILRWLMLRKGLGGGRVSAAFLVLYGSFRFALEFFREPDAGIGLEWFDTFSRGQLLCLGMILLGIFVFWRCGRAKPKPSPEGTSA